MVFDRVEDGAEVFRVVTAQEARNHERSIVHSEALLPKPSAWPSVLKWRAGSFVFDSGTGEGFVRQKPLGARYRRVRVRN